MNARSIVNKIDEFQAIIHDLQPDIVGITETWANDSILDAELTICFAVTVGLAIEEVVYCFMLTYP